MRYAEGYHSRFGAATQSRWVYLEGAGVGERLRAGRPTCVLEIGFGLALNALLTLDCARQCATELHYHTIDHDLIDAGQLQRLGYANLVSHGDVLGAVQSCLEQHRQVTGSSVVTTRAELANGGELQLIRADATQLSLKDGHYDAIYLDAFSPAVNPECWSSAFLASLYRSVKVGGTLTTYSVKGELRRTMGACGFVCGKCPGPPGKREMLRAVRHRL